MKLVLILIFIFVPLSFEDKGCGQRLSQRQGLGTIKRVNRVEDSTANIYEVYLMQSINLFNLLKLKFIKISVSLAGVLDQRWQKSLQWNLDI